MFLINKIFQFLSAAALLATLELLILREDLFWVLSSTSLVLIVITLWLFNNRKINRELVNFLIGPLIYAIACIGFSLFIEKNIFFHIFSAIASIFLFIYFGRILDYKFYPKRYQPYSLENFSWYLDIVTVFLFFSFSYAIITFLKVKFFFLIIPVIIVCLLLSYQLFWVNKIKFSESSVFVFTIAVVLAELFVAVYYLPTGFFVNALVLTIVFYLMSGLARYFLLGNLDKKKILNFLIVSAVCLIVIFASAQWV